MSGLKVHVRQKGRDGRILYLWSVGKVGGRRTRNRSALYIWSVVKVRQKSNEKQCPLSLECSKGETEEQ
jgi:hypothetical protein